MGTDIHIGVNNLGELLSVRYFDEKNNYKHSLSRTFCNFISRQYVVDGTPELDQIGEITGIDISPLYDMEKYQHEESTDTDTLQGNIDLVLKTIDSLINRLSNIKNLDQRLNDSGEDTLGYEFYFTDFNTDKGDGYIGNNFGQDLRNFKRFLEYAKTKGTTTVWLNFG